MALPRCRQNDPRRRPARPDRRGSILAEALRRGRRARRSGPCARRPGLGFAQAKDAIEGRPRAMRRSDLSPGEVPRRSGLARAVIVLLLLAALAYVSFGGKG